MTSLDHYLDEQLSRSQAYFSREEALTALGLNLAAFISEASRLARKLRFVHPSRLLPDPAAGELGRLYY